MKQSKFILGFFALVIAFSISSCGDDDDVTKSKTDLLTQHTWLAKSGTPADDFLVAFLIASQTEFTFKKDGTYSTTSLFDSDPQTGKWEFASGETKIILDKGTSDEQSIDISKLDDSNLEFKYVDGSDTYTILFAKK